MFEVWRILKMILFVCKNKVNANDYVSTQNVGKKGIADIIMKYSENKNKLKLFEKI